MQHNTVRGSVETVNRTDGSARCVGTVHTGNGHGSFTTLTIQQGYHMPPVYSVGDIMFIIAGRDTAIAFNATFGVAEEFHSGHVFSPFTPG
jgi:hypothetical protein